MLSIEEAKAIPKGKGIVVQKIAGGKYQYDALVLYNSDEHLRLVTENGALSKPHYKTYNKTWCVKCIN